MNTIVLDIETVEPELGPTQRKAITEIVRKGMAQSSPTAEEVTAEVRKYLCLCPPLARVAAVSMGRMESDGIRIFYDQSIVGYEGDDEAIPHAEGESTLLTAVFEQLAKAHRLVTFNGRGFDLPVLHHAARRLHLGEPRIITDALAQKPWEEAPHIDLLQVLTCNKATRWYPLEVYAIAYGTPNPKENHHGGDFWRLAQEDPSAAIGYCKGDVRAEMALYKKISAPPDEG